MKHVHVQSKFRGSAFQRYLESLPRAEADAIIAAEGEWLNRRDARIAPLLRDAAEQMTPPTFFGSFHT